MPRRRVLFASSLLCLVVVVAFGSERQTAPLNSGDDSASLEDAISFIRDTLGSLGEVSYVAQYHDKTTGKDWTSDFTQQITDVIAYPPCRLDYNQKESRDGSVIVGLGYSFRLMNVSNMRVVPIEESLRELDTAEGHPEYAAKVDRRLYVLQVNAPAENPARSYDFDFREEVIAKQVAQALLHAVNLCGGKVENAIQ